MPCCTTEYKTQPSRGFATGLRRSSVVDPGLVPASSIDDRSSARGAVFVDALRTTPFERFFFREPVNGYFFEVIDRERRPIAR